MKMSQIPRDRSTAADTGSLDDETLSGCNSAMYWYLAYNTGTNIILIALFLVCTYLLECRDVCERTM